MAAWSLVGTRRLRGRAVARDPAEEHRTASSLELLFDLTFVVAINQASSALDHELLAGHVADGLIGFATVFMAVWWAWMNFTWFNSAHDADDPTHRFLTLVQMAGVLVLAAGVSPAVEDRSLEVIVLGYVIMRLGLIAAWLRVARDVPVCRTRALRYAGGFGALQVLWIARQALPPALYVPSFAALAFAELLVPLWAERAAPSAMFHPSHIEERYGLFTLILLGESILSATVGFQAALDAGGLSPGLLAVGIGGLVIAFAAWWLYFDHPGHLAPGPMTAFRWGYGHVVVFASLTALGAGIRVAAETVAGSGDAGTRVAALAVAIPLAGYLLGLALVMMLTGVSPLDPLVLPKFAGAAVLLAIGAVAPVAVTVAGCAAVMAALALLMVVAEPPERARAG
jgi:low temperature requirement protein LtrA